MEPHENHAKGRPTRRSHWKGVVRHDCIRFVRFARKRAENGDQEAVDELIELAASGVIGAGGMKSSGIPRRWAATASRPGGAFVRDLSNRSPAKMADRLLAMNRGSTGQRSATTGGWVAMSDLPASQHSLRSGHGLRTAN
jgi:hypothetical protein